MVGELNDDADSRPGEATAGDTSDRQGAVERRYRRIFEHGNDAILIIDLDAETFADVNPAACELLGYSQNELLSMCPEDIHPQDMERVREEFISQVREEGTGFTDDLTCVTKEGRSVSAEVSGAALHPEEDDPTRMIAMVRDVSERVERRKELEATVERLNQFASIVSHDLRNHLSLVKIHAALARETGDPEHFEAVDAAADRMEELLSELLTLARGGDVIGDRTAVELETAAREAWDDVDPDVATLEVESSAMVRADRSRLRELFANLFENAVTHGGSDVTVRLGTLGTGGEAGFYVEDDGDGIPPDDRDAVLEWGHTTATDGTGFGLAIVTEVAEAHGWTVGVTEAESGGARFELTGVSSASAE
jgi:PAS domain S-box-containing protein